MWVLDKFWTWSLAYVALSRVKTPGGLFIVQTVLHKNVTVEMLNKFVKQSNIIQNEY